jgi:hypothetical protein
MDSSPPRVAVVGDRISVQASGTPLGEVLTNIEQITGIEFEVDEGLLEEKIFVDFKELSLPEGIGKLLPSNSHAIIYDSSGKIDKVVIVARDKSADMIRRKANDQNAAAISAGADAGLSSNGGTQKLQSSPYRSRDKLQPAETMREGPLGAEEGSQAPPHAPNTTVPKGPPWENGTGSKSTSASNAALPKGPPTEDTVIKNPPPGSDVVVPSGPPWEQDSSQEPPSSNSATTPKGPPGADAPPPLIPQSPPTSKDKMEANN